MRLQDIDIHPSLHIDVSTVSGARQILTKEFSYFTENYGISITDNGTVLIHSISNDTVDFDGLLSVLVAIKANGKLHIVLIPDNDEEEEFDIEYILKDGKITKDGQRYIPFKGCGV